MYTYTVYMYLYILFTMYTYIIIWLFRLPIGPSSLLAISHPSILVLGEWVLFSASWYFCLCVMCNNNYMHIFISMLYNENNCSFLTDGLQITLMWPATGTPGGRKNVITWMRQKYITTAYIIYNKPLCTHVCVVLCT